MAKKTARAAKAAAQKARSAAARSTAVEHAKVVDARGGPRKVQAIEVGYYDHVRRRVGDVFSIAKPSDFSEKWMTYVDKRTPDRITTGQEDINRQHDELLSSKMAEKNAGATGADNPIGAE